MSVLILTHAHLKSDMYQGRDADEDGGDDDEDDDGDVMEGENSHLRLCFAFYLPLQHPNSNYIDSRNSSIQCFFLSHVRFREPPTWASV